MGPDVKSLERFGEALASDVAKDTSRSPSDFLALHLASPVSTCGSSLAERTAGGHCREPPCL